MDPLFLGVDGGQSSTTALIGNAEGRVVGAGIGGPCNHVGGPEGREKFLRAIGDCLDAACREAGLDPASVSFTAACLGFSGGHEDKEPLLRERLRTEKLLLSNDALIALSGATAGQPGIITIGGTGSISYGRNVDGKTARAGGWGYLFGDEGGGLYLARQALRATLQYEEGWGPETKLRRMLLEATGAASANELLHGWYTTEFSRPRIASYAVLVDKAAREGDTLARRTLHEAAGWLNVYTGAVRRQLFHPGEPARVAYIGGVFRSQILREEFCRLVELDKGNACGPPESSPAAGALLEAYRAAGLVVQLSNLPEFKT